MDSQLVPLFCNDDDVISIGNHTYKISKLQTISRQSMDANVIHSYHNSLANKGIIIAKEIISPTGSSSEYVKLFNNGIDCEVLKTDAKGWRKGKFRFKISFEILAEDYPDSSLDDIREAINDFRGS